MTHLYPRQSWTMRRWQRPMVGPRHRRMLAGDLIGSVFFHACFHNDSGKASSDLLARRPPFKSRRSSPTNFTAAESTCRLVLQIRFPRAGAVTPRQKFSWSTPIATHLGFAAAATTVAAMARHSATRSTSPNLSIRSRGKSCTAATWRPSRPPS